MVPVRPPAPGGGNGDGAARQGGRRRREPRVVNLPNDINAPTARVSYYKHFLEFMNFKDNNAYEYGRLFSE